MRDGEGDVRDLFSIWVGFLVWVGWRGLGDEELLCFVASIWFVDCGMNEIWTSVWSGAEKSLY